MALAATLGPVQAASRIGDEYGGGFMDLSNEESDFFFKGYLGIELLRAHYATGAAEPRQLLEGFVVGYDRWAEPHPCGRLRRAEHGGAGDAHLWPTDPKSAWCADPTAAYSPKEWPVLPFTQENIKADPTMSR